MMLERLALHAANRAAEAALTDGETVITYGELYERVTRFSDHLKNREVRCLAISVENGIDWVIADLAGLIAGITVVPVPQYFTTPQIDHLMASAQVDAILSCDVANPATGLSHSSLLATGLPADSSRPLKITFTSGSTGAPKGVVLQHSTLLTIAASIVQMMEQVDVQKHLCVLPLATLLENVAGVYAPLIKGIEVVVPPPETVGLSGSSGLDVGQFASCVNDTRPESMILVPQLLLATVTLAELNMLNTTPLKMVAVGGGKVAGKLIDKASKLGIPVFEGYGLSEAGSVVTLNLPGHTRAGSVGKVLPHARLRANESGELEVAGSVMEGYLGESMSVDWLKTGDAGYIDDDGYVYITGRIKNTFITAYGRNIHPEWVEAQFAQYPAIGQCLFYGEARPENLLLVWPRFPLEREQLAQMVEQVNQALPDYARVHRVKLLDEPLAETLITGNGRLRRQETLDRYRDVIEAQYQDDVDEQKQGADIGVLSRA